MKHLSLATALTDPSATDDDLRNAAAIDHMHDALRQLTGDPKTLELAFGLSVDSLVYSIVDEATARGGIEYRQLCFDLLGAIVKSSLQRMANARLVKEAPAHKFVSLGLPPSA